jgi:WD40 repeat protein
MAWSPFSRSTSSYFLDGGLFMTDLFISYSRQDQAFVRRLYERLTASGHDVFVDWAGIPASAEWMKEIQDAITRSDAVLFILSPDFAVSPICRTELALAEEARKRLIPIVYRDVPPQEAPEALAKRNWIFMRESDDFAAALAAVETAIATDLDYVHAATRLLVRAKEWEDRKENASLLLRGSELKEAESWLAGSGGREPPPSQLHTHYIGASRQTSSRRQRGVISVLSAVVALLVVLTSTTLLFYGQANQQRAIAEENATIATIRALAAQSLTTTFGVNLDERLLLSLLAVHKSDANLRYEARNSLLTLLQSNRDVVNYLHTPNARVADGPIRLAESADGNTLVSYSGAGLFVWDLQKQPITPRSLPLPRHYDFPSTTLLAISADGHYAAVAGSNGLADNDGETTVIDLGTGQVMATYPGFVPDALGLSADGKLLAASYLAPTGERAVAIWGAGADPLHPKARIVTANTVTRLAFNNAGTLLALGQDFDGTMMWDLTTGRVSQVAAIDVSGASSDTQPEDGLAFSTDGAWFVVSGASSIGQGGQTAIFKVTKGSVSLAAQLPGQGEITTPQNDSFYQVSCADILICTRITLKRVDLGAFSIGDIHMLDGVGVFAHVAGGTPLAVSTDNGSILLWRAPFQDYGASAQLPEGSYPESFFSPNGQVVAHFHDDRTLGLWNARSLKELTDAPQTRGILFGDATLKTVAVSNDAQEVAALEKSGQILVHRRTGVTPLADAPRILSDPLQANALVQLVMDWAGRHVAALTCIGPEASCATTEVDIWDAASGRRIAQRTFAGGASIAFTPDGKTLAVGQLNNVAFYDFAHNVVTAPLDVSEIGIVEGLGFDPSGKTMAAFSDFSRGAATPYGSANSGYQMLWDVPTGKQLGLPQAPELGATGLAFDEQGNLYTLATRFMYRYDYSLAALSKAACAIANRNMTRAEWQEVAGDEPYVKLCSDLP